MKELCKEHSVSMVCRTLGLPRSTHYARLGRGPSQRRRQDAELGEQIERIHRDNRCVYGCPRIHLALRLGGRRHSRRRVARLMAERGLRGRRRGGFKPALTDSRHDLGYDPNLLGRIETTQRPHQVWVSDTTYIRLGDSWAYLAATMDLHSRYIVGWSLSRCNDSDLAVAALETARRRHGGRNVLHHSDRGATYASKAFRKQLSRLLAQRSMSAKGNCYDNAAMESFFGTLKAECVQGLDFRDLEHLRRWLFAYIEGFYNTRRLHTSIGMAPRQKLEEALSERPSCSQGGCGDLTPAESSPPHEQLGLDTPKRVSNN